MIIGVDEGYTYMKTMYGLGENEKDMFKSTVKDGFEAYSTGLKVELEGIKYTVGTNKGNYCSDLSKINDKKTELLLFTAIAKVLLKCDKATGEEIDLVVGLPSGQYDSMKKDKRKSLLDRSISLKLNSIPVTFHIRRVLVMPQCSGYFLVEDLKGEYLVIDWGGITWDITEFSDGQPGKKRSYVLGMQTLYSKLIDDIYSMGAKYELHRGEEILRDRVIITKDGEVPYNPSEIILNHIQNGIEQEVKFDFPQFDNVRKRWIGGGSLACKEWIGEEDINEDTVYTNAKIYYMVGADRF